MGGSPGREEKRSECGIRLLHGENGVSGGESNHHRAKPTHNKLKRGRVWLARDKLEKWLRLLGERAHSLKKKRF